MRLFVIIGALTYFSWQSERFFQFFVVFSLVMIMANTRSRDQAERAEAEVDEAYGQAMQLQMTSMERELEDEPLVN